MRDVLSNGIAPTCPRPRAARRGQALRNFNLETVTADKVRRVYLTARGRFVSREAASNRARNQTNRKERRSLNRQLNGHVSKLEGAFP